MSKYGVMTDYDYGDTHKRDRVTLWSGAFASVWEADGYSLPNGKGYMLTTYNGEKVRVECSAPRRDDNYLEIDSALSGALELHYGE